MMNNFFSPERNDNRLKTVLRQPWPYFFAAFACTVLESAKSFDRLAQVPFFRHGEWLISDAFHTDYKWIYYTAPKILIGVVGGTFLVIFLASLSGRYRLQLQVWSKPSALIACSVILVPLAVSVLTCICGVHSPVDMLPYGGKYPHIGLLEQLWEHGSTAGGRSFPAGHASGGFALMALYYLPLRELWKRFLFILGFFAGWGMGLYQMARGEHFLSHTLTSMFLALGIIILLERHFDGLRQRLKALAGKK